jgi:hypothetical protein
MFVGVMQKKNATHLWRMLYFQGIFWILTAMSTEVPSVVSYRHDYYFCILMRNPILSRSSPL